MRVWRPSASIYIHYDSDSGAEIASLNELNIHERIIRSARRREDSIGSVDLNKIAVIASKAYWAADDNNESVEVAEQRALEALSHTIDQGSSLANKKKRPTSFI